MAKYLIVCGGVVSGCGKGISAASIGLLMRMRGHKTVLIKFDPFLNSNSGTLAPAEHGESFVTDDGVEVDCDLGSYFRVAGTVVSRQNICTSGTLHKELISEQENGKYLGQTIQVQPHLTNKIQQRLIDIGENQDIVIAEIGGTVGDAESFAFFEAIRQFKQKNRDDVIVAMVAPIIWLNTVGEFKTKPLQNAIKDLQRHGLSLDMVFCRAEKPIPDKILSKVSSLMGIPRQQIFEAPDVPTIYQVPVEFYNRHVDDLIVDLLRLPRSACRIHKYREQVEKLLSPDLKTINIGIVGKYDIQDAYISVKEAVLHAGLANDVRIVIRWIRAEDLEKYKDARGLHKYFEGLSGVIVPGGFDKRGVEGKIKAAQFCRERKIPFLGICLGLQCAVIEFARNVCGLDGANSLEFDKDTPNPVIHYIEGQEGLVKKCGTMRLGAFDCELAKDSLASRLYESRNISECHRHRYEVNPAYTDCFEKKGFRVVGKNPQSGLIEVMEIVDHPFFIGSQFHGEFRSRLTEPAPLFRGLVAAAVNFLPKTLNKAE